MDEWPPFWPLRFSDQAHVSVTREPVAFARIAADARTNHILPRRRPSPVAGNNMIQIELAAIENLAAVLAGVLVALEHVVARKFHFLLWEPIENKKHNHTWNADLKRNRRDDFVGGRVCRQTAPAFEIMCHEIVRLIGRNNVSVTRINQREGATGGADIHRLPEPVEYQNLTV